MTETIKYTINSYKNLNTLPNGVSKFEVYGNMIDKDKCSMALIGKNMPNYGETQSENYLHLLQHFCSDSDYAPGVVEPAVEGQVWYDKEDDGFNLKVCTQGGTGTNVKWEKISHIILSDSAPTTHQGGDFWYDTSSYSLKVYDTNKSQWMTIGMEDVIHKTYDTQNIVISESGSGSFVIPSSLYKLTIYNDSEEKTYSNGCCALLTSKIVAKEMTKYESTPYYDGRCKVWIYKYVVRSFANPSGSLTPFTCQLIGSPSYEIIAQQDNESAGLTADDWDIDVSLNSNGEIKLDVTAEPNTNAYVVVECNTELERV